MKQILLFMLLLLCTAAVNAQPLLLQEDFRQNNANTTMPEADKTLGSGVWRFYYADKNYNSVTECAVLKYNSSTTGYIITPALDRPAVLTFDARTAGNVSNRIEIQKSVNGGAFTTVESVLVSGADYQPYTVNINESNAAVRLKFLRGKPSQDGSNYNILIDNVQISGSTAPLLQLSNGKQTVARSSEFCLDCSGGISYIDIPFTISNAGSEILVVSGIETFGCTVVDNNTPFYLTTGGSADITARIDCNNGNSSRTFLAIRSNSADCEMFTVIFNASD